MDESLQEMVQNLSRKAYSELHSERPFIPGTTAVPVTGKVFGQEE